MNKSKWMLLGLLATLGCGSLLDVYRNAGRWANRSGLGPKCGADLIEPDRLWYPPERHRVRLLRPQPVAVLDIARPLRPIVQGDRYTARISDVEADAGGATDPC